MTQKSKPERSVARAPTRHATRDTAPDRPVRRVRIKKKLDSLRIQEISEILGRYDAGLKG
jgi:hypothetical protein